MRDFIVLSNKRQRLIYEQAQSRTGLPAASLEKDFWVCWTLNQLFKSNTWGQSLTFKGGTSLSKYCAYSQKRAIRPVAVGRKNYLFAGSKRGARNTAVIYSLLSTCELNGVNTYDYLKDILEKLVNNWPAHQIDDLLLYRWKELNAPSTDE